jgi:uncharacterized protein
VPGTVRQTGLTRLEVLSPAECIELLAQERFGRVGVSVAALPVILPVNYTLFGGSVLFRTVAGTKLAAATRRAVVAFEVDSYRDDGRAGWSVLVVGEARELTGEQELERAREVGLEPWGAPEAASHFVVVEISQVSGRRFERGAAAGRA